MISRSPSKAGAWRRGAALAVALLALAVAAARAEDSSIADLLQQQITRLFEQSRHAVVRIQAEDDHGKIAGTGFFIDPNGTLYTSYSIGGDTRNIMVVQGDQKFPARRIAADDHCGVALLKVDAKTDFLPLGSSKGLAMGTPLMTIGFPMDLPLTPAFGVLGGFDRKYLGLYFATTHIRANVPVQRGEGGAPLLNLKGEVVGILISSLDGGSASFALPAEAAEKIRRDYVRFGEARPGWLGLEITASSDPVEGSTAQISKVFLSAPAEKAGLKPSDVVVQMGQTKIASPEDMLDACFYLSAEDLVTITIVRGEERLEFKLEAADPPGHQQTPDALGSTNESAPRLKIGK